MNRNMYQRIELPFKDVNLLSLHLKCPFIVLGLPVIDVSSL